MQTPLEHPLTVLVLGSGGREHALVQAARKSPRVARVLAAPGNGGMAREATSHAIDMEKPGEVLALCRAEKVGLVLIGPEVPLCAGLADALRADGFSVYGPGKAGAELEGSKAFSKAFMERHDIPTAASRTFSDVDAALAYLRGHALPVVVKASGLAAGKGVVIARSEAEAEAAVRDMLSGEAFGESGQTVVIEEFLEGEEASVMLMVSGEKVVTLPYSQDHKRAHEGDEGPNTGGMGAYAPAAVVDTGTARRIDEEIVRPSLRGLVADGIDFRGTLYVGVMLTEKGPKVLEYNVRFGDPETQVLLPLLESDPVELFLACANGTLEPENVRLRSGYALTVVLASGGYPGAYEKGKTITLPDDLPEDTFIFHAGTKQNDDGTLVTAGGRVLNVTALGPTLREAAEKAYALCDRIDFEGKMLRRDIGWRQLAREG